MYGHLCLGTDMLYFLSRESTTVFTQSISINKNVISHIQVDHENSVTVEEEREGYLRVSGPLRENDVEDEWWKQSAVMRGMDGDETVGKWKESLEDKELDF